MRRILRSSSLVALIAFGAAPGCFAVADLGRFHPGKDEGTTPDAGDSTDGATEGGMPEAGVDDPTKPSDLVLTLQNMGVHFQQLIEARVIDSSNGIQTRIMIQPLDTAGRTTITVRVPSAIQPEGQPYRLDFYGDVNYSGKYDGIGNVLTQDHAWRIDPLVDYPAGKFPHVANVTQVTFLHSTLFTDIDKVNGVYNPARDTGLSARIRFDAASLAPYKDKLIQVNIRDTRSGHTVAVYRNPQIPATDFIALLPGVLDDGFDYFVNIYIDANGNGVYDDPSVPAAGADLGFSIPVRSTASIPTPDAGSTAAADADPDAATDDAGEPEAATPPSTEAGSDSVFGIDIPFDLTKTPYPNNAKVDPP